MSISTRSTIASGLLVVALTWPHPGATQAVTQPGARAVAPATSAAPAARLPVRRVMLYKSGIGYFEHLGRVSGDQTLSIDLTSGQLDDVLKSLTTIDLGGGVIRDITYNTEAPLEQRLATLRLSLGQQASRAALFTALRGARVDVSAAGGVHTGRVLSLEPRARTRDGATISVDEIVIVSDAGEVRAFELTPAVSVRVADADLRQQVGQYLDLVGSARAQDVRRLAIATRGAGERSVFVSYISAVPVWKTTYRLVVPSAADRKPLLQGWAIVDNTLGEDWQNVELSLVAGAPQSFVQRISQPYYVDRPRVELPPRVSLTPQTHAGAITQGSATVSGRVTDAGGAPLPGASIVASSDAGHTVQAVAAADGGFSFTVSPGRYRVEASLTGFMTAAQDVSVYPGSTTLSPFALQVGALTESVSVAARAAAPRFRSGAAGGSLGGVVGGLPGAPPPPPPPPAFDMLRSAEAAAQAADLGDLFEYKLKEPVTIRRNQSALVPIVQADVSVEKVSLWNAATGRPRPLRAMWVTNGTGLTLDGGSVTLIEGEAFAGEGLIEPLRPGERRLLSYAIDLGAQVDAKRDADPQKVTRISIARGIVRQQSEERNRATYTVRNDDATSRQVVIEHPVRAGWTIVGAAKPVESSAAAHRFRVAVEPRSTVTLIVDETRPVENRYHVSTLSDDLVTLIVKSRGVDPAVEGRLGAIAEKKRVVAALEREMAQKTEEIERISDGQARVRENMKALKGSDAEKELIQRYTRQLSAEETRIETLLREGAELDAKKQTAAAELTALIEALTLDVAMGGD